MIALHFIHTYPNLPHTICSILPYVWGKQTQILKSSIHLQALTYNQNTRNSSAATSAPIFNVHAPHPLKPCLPLTCSSVIRVGEMHVFYA